MKVALLQLPQQVSPTNYVSTVAIPPLGLAYVAAALERAGHAVRVVDALGGAIDRVHVLDGVPLRGMTQTEILEAIPADSGAIGIGCMFSCQWPYLRALACRIRERFPGVPLILGGEHPTALPELTLREAPFDYLVLGEGEETAVALADCLAQGRVPGPEMPGIAMRDGGQARVHPRRERIRDLDAIAPPAWHLFDVEAYLRFGSPHGASRGRYMPLLATRGCPYRCTFCSSPEMWTTAWAARDPDRVIDEIEDYRRRYGARDFHFEDLTAVVRKDWVLAFSRRLRERGVPIGSWQLPSGTRSEAIDRECAEAMYASGCRNFSYAIESGSEETLALVRKRIHLPRVFASARLAMAAGIRVQALFIYGFPHERAGHLWRTYRTVLACAWRGFHEVNIGAFCPLPNTEAFRELDRERPIALTDGYFASLFGYLDLRQYRSWNPRLSDRALQALILWSYLSFFVLSFLLRPWRLAQEMALFPGRRSPGKLGKYLRQMARGYRQARAASGP